MESGPSKHICKKNILPGYPKRKHQTGPRSPSLAMEVPKQRIETTIEADTELKQQSETTTGCVHTEI